jgi:hypothetical protein
MLDEAGGVVCDVLWRSLHAVINNAETIATDNAVAFITSPFVTNAKKTKGNAKRVPLSHCHRTERACDEPSVRARTNCRKLPTSPHDLQHSLDSDAWRSLS